MKVVFLEEVPGSGYPGDVKDVANGFARNYLLPRNLAKAATKQALQQATRLAEAEARRQEKLDHAASGVADKLNGQTLTFVARVGDQGRLFGSITAGDIAEEATKLAGEEVDRHRVHLSEPIKEIGTRPVRIRFTRNIEVKVNVDVRPLGEVSGEAAPAEAEAEPTSEETEEAEATTEEPTVETEAPEVEAEETSEETEAVDAGTEEPTVEAEAPEETPAAGEDSGALAEDETTEEEAEAEAPDEAPAVDEDSGALAEDETTEDEAEAATT